MVRSRPDKNPRRRRNGNRAKAGEAASGPKKRFRGSRILPLLGLGVLGWVASTLLRSSSRPLAKARRLGDSEPQDIPTDSLTGHSRGPDSRKPDARGPAFETSEIDTISWIAGPAGNLRILERHSSGKIPLVFIHGLGGCLEHWLPLIGQTGPAIHSVAMDLPGHGASDLEDADEGASIIGLAHSVIAVLDSLRLKNVVLVGHDLGAAVAMQVAAKNPGRVQGLFLIDPNGDQSRLGDKEKQQVLKALAEDPLEEVRWQFQQILTSALPRVADRVLADLAECRGEALLEAVRSSLSFSPPAALESYSGPRQVLISELNDLPYSLHKMMPDLPWALLPEASHWLMMDASQGVWEALVDFLDRQVVVST